MYLHKRRHFCLLPFRFCQKCFWLTTIEICTLYSNDVVFTYYVRHQNSILIDFQTYNRVFN